MCQGVGSSVELDAEANMNARAQNYRQCMVSGVQRVLSPRNLSLLLLLAMLVGSATAPRDILDVKGISYALLHKEPERGVLVITERVGGSIWFVTHGSQVYQMDNVPRPMGSCTWGIAISPDDKYIAAITESGDDWGVEVFPLAPLVEDDMYDRTARHVDPVASVYSWLAATRMVGWIDNTTLEITCDRPLHLSTPDNRGMTDDPASYPREHFLWDIPTDTIRKK
jgi:hypothetical protein